MLCYRDMRFCPFYESCVFNARCIRALTPEVIKRAKQIDMPIAQFIDKPDCHKQRVT